MDKFVDTAHRRDVAFEAYNWAIDAALRARSLSNDNAQYLPHDLIEDARVLLNDRVLFVDYVTSGAGGEA